MAVLLPDRDLTVTRRGHPWRRDARGLPLPSDADAQTPYGPTPGAAREQPDGSWTLRVDPGAWPVNQGDRISDGTRVWVVTLARLNSVPGHPDVDFIAVTATLDPPKVP